MTAPRPPHQPPPYGPPPQQPYGQYYGGHQQQYPPTQQHPHTQQYPPTQQYGPSPQPYPPYTGAGPIPPRPTRRRWPWIVAAVVVLLVVVIAVVYRPSSPAGQNGGTAAADGSGSAAPAAPPATDVAAGQTATTSDGLAITATPLASVEVEYLGEYSCTTVTYVNGSSEEVLFSSIDWKLQNPQGAAVSSNFTGRESDLSAGELAPGGTVSGELCFEGYAPGRYVLIFEELISFDPERLTWINDLQ